MTKKTEETEADEVRSQVREHYGRIAADFEPNSCCEPSQSLDCGCSPGESVKTDLVSKLYETPEAAELPEDVTALSLGCGDPVTLASLERGQTVLDLGSGGGIDCFLAGKKVGENGRVIGIDMTSAMLEKARTNKAKLGADNVEFRLGEIEHLPVSDDSVDVVISNCVINLSPDKPQVFSETFRVLRSGGRLAVSDIVTDGPLPTAIKQNMAAWAGCVSGALEREDYIAAIKAAGFVDIELEPVYLDKAFIEEAIDQLGLGDELEAGNGKQQRAMIVEENKTRTIELDTEQAEGENVYQRAIFSAKVTARKP